MNSGHATSPAFVWSFRSFTLAGSLTIRSHNEFSGFNLPAPSLIQRLGLASKNREIDFYDSMGKLRNALSRSRGRVERRSAQPLLRPCRSSSTLSDRYAPSTGLVQLGRTGLAERRWKVYDVLHESTRRPIYRAYNHIHRSFFQWSAKDLKIV